jgi:hypothetical protein
VVESQLNEEKFDVELAYPIKGFGEVDLEGDCLFIYYVDRV